MFANRFTRPEPEERTARLERLDQELIQVYESRIDTLFASHGGHRLRIIVERSSIERQHWVSERDFKASAEFNGHEYFAHGYSPSAAFIKLLAGQLVPAIDIFNSERNVVSIAARAKQA